MTSRYPFRYRASKYDRGEVCECEVTNLDQAARIKVYKQTHYKISDCYIDDNNQFNVELAVATTITLGKTLLEWSTFKTRVHFL